MVKLHIRVASSVFLLLLFLFSPSCQKKEVLQAEDPDPVIGPIGEPCPGCEFPDSTWPSNSAAVQLNFRLRLDSNLANPFVLPSGHSAQSPTLVALALEQIELMPEATTLPGQGVMLYAAPQSSCAGNQYNPLPTNYCKLHLIGDSELVCSVAMNAVPARNYKWLRLSAAYSEMKILSRNTSSGNGPSTFAGFYSNATYVTKIRTQTAVLTPTITGIKGRGYYLFDQDVFGQAVQFEGHSPRQTVVNDNPVQTNSSEIFVEFTDQSGLYPKPLLITANATTSQEVKLIFGTRKLFEWQEKTADGLFQPEIGETVYDFGFRSIQARH